MFMTTAAPITAASQATATPIQRRRQMPRRWEVSWASSSSMVVPRYKRGDRRWRLEPALRDDQYVPGLDVHVRADVAALDEIPETYAVELSALGGPEDGRRVPVGEVGESADRDHDVEQRHVLAIRERLRLLRFADHADLLAIRSDEGRDDHRDDRVPDVLRERLLDVARKSRRVFAERREILDERACDLAVGADRDDHRDLRIPPHDDVHRVERADEIVVVRRRCFLGRERIFRRGATRQEERDGRQPPIARRASPRSRKRSHRLISVVQKISGLQEIFSTSSRACQRSPILIRRGDTEHLDWWPSRGQKAKKPSISQLFADAAIASCRLVVSPAWPHSDFVPIEFPQHQAGPPRRTDRRCCRSLWRPCDRIPRYGEFPAGQPGDQVLRGRARALRAKRRR